MTRYRDENSTRITGKRLGAIWASAALCVVAMLAASVAAQDAKKVTLEDIRKAWQQRQDKVKSARVVYDERQIHTKGAIKARLEKSAKRKASLLRGKGNPNTPAPLPQVRDTTFDVPSYLLLDGNKAYSSRELSELSFATGTFEPAPLVASYDGKKETTLKSKGSPNLRIPQGQITPANRSLQIRNPPLTPLIMAFRPFAADLRLLNLDAFTVTGRQSVIAGRTCVELLKESARAGGGTRLWLNPSRDYSIMRILMDGSNKYTEKIDIRYRPDAIAGWVPESWEMVYWMGKEEIQRKWIGAVTNCEINVPISAGEFAIDFPGGTRVDDEVNKLQYIVKSTGGKRVIPPEDMGATYEQMLDSKPGEARTSRRGWGWTPWAFGLAGCSVAVLCLGWLIRKRWRANSPPGGASVSRDA